VIINSPILQGANRVYGPKHDNDVGARPGLVQGRNRAGGNLPTADPARMRDNGADPIASRHAGSTRLSQHGVCLCPAFA